MSPSVLVVLVVLAVLAPLAFVTPRTAPLSGETRVSTDDLSSGGSLKYAASIAAELPRATPLPLPLPLPPPLLPSLAHAQGAVPAPSRSTSATLPRLKDER